VSPPGPSSHPLLDPKLLKAVLFDWDGTLLNSYQADARAYALMFRALGIPWTPSDLERHYSPDWYQVYRAAAIPEDRWEEADRLWRRFYRQERPPLQPGARRVLQRLARHFPLGLVTSGSGWRVRAQLRSMGLTSMFAIRIYGDDTPHKKPHPAALRIAMRGVGCRAAHCVYVGDTPEDVRMARRAGVAVIGVAGHSPVPARLRAAQPDILIETLSALPKLLLGR
jgi:HAD superfamily hydrolase (TIGR01549 family)